jgi:aspartyl-tRNA(Asn)/glutamyl-tRNA(Gln) amidotransferase subunit A
LPNPEGGARELFVMHETAFLTVTGLADLLRHGEIGPVQLTEQLLERIEEFDGKLNAFRVLTRDRALAEAEAAEAALRSGREVGVLHGVPYAVKDLFDVKGVSTSAGTHLLDQNAAASDCAVVRRLSQAGMVLLGKTHTVQFAFGGVGINHDQGTPHNPWQAEAYAPGGSSSGSAVAVASGMVPAALGSDTGGSVRIPAALCATVGLKTTVGRISRMGVYPLSWTLDSVGPLTRSVEDAALLFSAMQGPDWGDDTTLAVPMQDVLTDLKAGVKGLRVVFGESIFFDGVDPEVAAAVWNTGDVFKALGAHVDRMAVPEADEAFASRKRALMIAAEACVVNQPFLDEHFDALDPVVSQRMIAGRTMTAPDYAGLLRQWGELRKRVVRTLQDVDALIVPTTMIPARPLNEIDVDVDTYMAYNGQYLRNTSIGNILNLCGVSVPCGFTSQGLPIGLMVYAKPFQEAKALRVSYAYEQATPWHDRHPTLPR